MRKRVLMATISRSQFADIRAAQLGRPVCADPECDARPLKTSDMCGRHKRRSKYHAEATEAHGKIYPSKLEADRGAELRYLLAASEIADLREQAVVNLAGSVDYRADFFYREVATDRLVYEDAKGILADRFRVVCQLWPLWGPNMLRISKREHGRIVIVKEILPQPQARVLWMQAEIERLIGTERKASA
jgi:hypothetical protein